MIERERTGPLRETRISVFVVVLVVARLCNGLGWPRVIETGDHFCPDATCGLLGKRSASAMSCSLAQSSAPMSL